MQKAASMAGAKPSRYARGPGPSSRPAPSLDASRMATGAPSATGGLGPARPGTASTVAPPPEAPTARLVRRVASAVLLAVAARAAAADESDLCLLAAQDATRLSGVPLSVLLAVTLTETGRDGGGGVSRPWPWTVNVAGEGHWFPTRDEAAAFAQGRLDAGETGFDVGCFQLNWRWHGENFVSVEQMFDPLANASYAAGYLKTQAAETGDWSVAAGAYHSGTPEHAARYRAIFDAHRAAAVAAGADEGPSGGRLAGPLALSGTLVAQAPGAAPRENTYPLLQAPSGAPVLGSLVPLGG